MGLIFFWGSTHILFWFSQPVLSNLDDPATHMWQPRPTSEHRAQEQRYEQTIANQPMWRRKLSQCIPGQHPRMQDSYNPNDHSCPAWVLVARATAWIDDGIASGVPSLSGKSSYIPAFHKHVRVWSAKQETHMAVLGTIIWTNKFSQEMLEDPGTKWGKVPARSSPEK